MFAHVAQAKPDSIFGVQEAYKKALAAYNALPRDHVEAAPAKKPISLVIGAYRTSEGKPWVLPVVAEVEREILGKEDHEYLPMGGHPGFKACSQKLVFGANSADIATCQTLSGTGALNVGFNFLHRFCGVNVVLVSDPTWGNHLTIAEYCGLKPETYPYYDNVRNCLRWDEMVQRIRTCDPHAAVLLHPAAHNPTGLDPSSEQWEQLAQVFLERRTLIPFFDSAYQGYASGDLEADVFPIRLFLQKGLNVVVSQSYSKNLGLYGERIGAIHIKCDTPAEATHVQSQLDQIARVTYSNPPSYGARIVNAILSNPAKYEHWKQCLNMMNDRLCAMRHALRNKLEELAIPGRNWDHIVAQKGMFSYTGLTKPQVEYMIEHHKVFLLGSGRMSIAGLTPDNVERVALAMRDAILNASPKN